MREPTQRQQQLPEWLGWLRATMGRAHPSIDLRAQSITSRPKPQLNRYHTAKINRFRSWGETKGGPVPPQSKAKAVHGGTYARFVSRSIDRYAQPSSAAMEQHGGGTPRRSWAPHGPHGRDFDLTSIEQGVDGPLCGLGWDAAGWAVCVLLPSAFGPAPLSRLPQFVRGGGDRSKIALAVRVHSLMGRCTRTRRPAHAIDRHTHSHPRGSTQRQAVVSPGSNDWRRPVPHKPLGRSILID